MKAWTNHQKMDATPHPKAYPMKASTNHQKMDETNHLMACPKGVTNHLMACPKDETNHLMACPKDVTNHPTTFQRTADQNFRSKVAMNHPSATASTLKCLRDAVGLHAKYVAIDSTWQILENLDGS